MTTSGELSARPAGHPSEAPGEDPPAAAATLLDFWLGTPPVNDAAAAGARVPLWFGKRPEDDRRIRTEFGPLLRQADGPALRSWQDSPRGTLALVILRDQIPRVVHRDSERAFAFDDANLALVRAMVRAGGHLTLAPIERFFLYMPYMHSEVAVIQDESVALYQELAATSGESLRPFLQQVLGFAERHREIVARFGRFPHRNQALGRTTTAAEAAFLLEPGSSF